jgi:hypothetical protein
MGEAYRTHGRAHSRRKWENDTETDHMVTQCEVVSCFHAAQDRVLCLFVVYLTMLFQYLRLYSVDFYSIPICLPSSSEAGETRVRELDAEFCLRAPIVLVGFFYMPQIYDMGPTALLPL